MSFHRPTKSLKSLYIYLAYMYLGVFLFNGDPRLLRAAPSGHLQRWFYVMCRFVLAKAPPRKPLAASLPIPARRALG